MNLHEPLRALIIGAGKIAAGYDEPGAGNVLTHAHGYRAVPGFSLVGFVDRDALQAERAAAKWGGKAFSSLEAAFAAGPINVVSVATPDETHATVLQELAAYGPRLVFCEKPLAQNWADAESIATSYRGSSTEIQLNYLRRFVPEFCAVKRRIAAGEYGRFLTGSGYYVNGFLHNGSHMVDLLQYWLGAATGAQELPGGKARSQQATDTMPVDADKTVALHFSDGGLFTVQALPGNPYWVFEMELLFEKKRLRVLDSGLAIQEYSLGENRVFPGTLEMQPQPIQNSGLDRAMQHAMQNIRDHLLVGEPLICPLPDALATLKTGLLRV